MESLVSFVTVLIILALIGGNIYQYVKYTGPARKAQK